MEKTVPKQLVVIHGRACAISALPFLLYNRIFKRNPVGYQPHTRLRPIKKNKVFLNTFFDIIFCLNTQNKQELVKGGFKNVRVVPNPIPMKRMYGQILEKQVKEFDVVWAGREGPSKRLNEFIHTICQNKKITALILAPKFERENLEDAAKCENITMVEGLDGSKFFEMLQKAKCFVFTSNENEGFPISILEAAFLSIPIVCSDYPKYREMLGDYAQYFSSWDELLTIIEEVAKNKEIKVDQAARQWILKQYSPKRIAKIYNEWDKQ
ncbi:glycosyltransferase [Candidatus Micrarchaeota archaeon]|nr:glycosyltransferase [Candidatus Micrarchaeota archaeon]